MNSRIIGIDQVLLKQLLRAIYGEYSSIACYEKLAQLAPTEAIRSKILEIRTQEQEHYLAFTSFYMQLTSGQRPKPKLLDRCPPDFQTGLQVALKNEQETHDLYLGLAVRIAYPQIKETFRNIAAQEHEHARWFHYYLNSGGYSK